MNQPVDFQQVANNGLWNNNPALVQILGLCPLLAVTTTVVNAIGLGLATILTLTLTNGTVAAIRSRVRTEVRIPIFVVIIASVVTVVELTMNAYFHDLYKILGIFIALIVTNCVVIARAEAFASKNSVPTAMFDGAMMGLGFGGVLLILGAMREVLGQGTLLADAHLLFGDSARWLTVSLSDDYGGFLFAVLPPGAFIGLALLIALKNVIDARRARRVPVANTAPVSAPNDGAVEGARA